MDRARSWWGWGWVEEALPDAACTGLASGLVGCATVPVPVPAIDMAPPRIRPPAALADRFSDDPAVRAAHTYGKAFRDVVRALVGDLTPAPDLLAFPRTEADVVDVLDWAGAAGVAVLPYGGGSSVVGGTEWRGEGPAVSLDLTRLDRVLEADATSRAARVQGGTLGPGLEDQLRPHGLTMRHFPQSFEFSTVGGWLATRSGGHYAMGGTHVDDFVQSLRVVTPVGVSESWRLPGSGAGPSPDRLFLGSEGTLGVITEAWLRVQRRPERHPPPRRGSRPPPRLRPAAPRPVRRVPARGEGDARPGRHPEPRGSRVAGRVSPPIKALMSSLEINKRHLRLDRRVRWPGPRPPGLGHTGGPAAARQGMIRA